MSNVNSPVDLLVFVGQFLISCLYLKNRDNSTFSTRFPGGQKLDRKKKGGEQ